MKIVVALAALLTLGAAQPQHVLADPYQHDESAIVRVACFKPQGRALGTAFKVSHNGYITARHVVFGGECFVEGQRVTITSSDAKNDYATFIGPVSPFRINVSCASTVAGRVYVARGFPGGGLINAYQPWLATSIKLRGFEPFRVFVGDVFPGMSGGPVLDEWGRAVGVVSKRNPTMATSIKMTGFCG